MELLKLAIFHLMRRHFADTVRCVAFCNIFIYYNESSYRLPNDTKTDDPERRMWVYNVRKLHRPRMSDAFLADTVDTIRYDLI